MTGRRNAARDILPLRQPSRSLLVLAALCLVTMPQNYRGGAEFAHPHAIFQFWIAGGHVSADHHHGEEVIGDDDHHSPTSHSSLPVTAPVRADLPDDVPTLSQMTTAERADAIGSVLSTWFVLVLVAAAGLFVLRGLRPGLVPLPERPPPRFAVASL
jgi:hypothetical protein